jgi:hypothetical protein
MSVSNPESSKVDIMTARSVVHASFTITRTWNASPARVFEAFAKEDAKSKWFSGGGQWTLVSRRFDFREGGIEIHPEPGGTKLVLTEYGDYLDGYDDAGSREHGTNLLIDALGKSLES